MSVRLEASAIVKTLQQLTQRAHERFPDSSFVGVCSHLLEVAKQTGRRAKTINRPNLLLRSFVLILIGFGLAAQVVAVRSVDSNFSFSDINILDLTQALEAIVNLAILAGAAIWFLLSLEEKLKRQFIFKQLHELRSFAHVIDMHQLTKDPVSLAVEATRTASSPERQMTPYELARYLDYCAEMLALIGKLAALYGEQTTDSEVTGGVNDIETLTTGLGRKIWQKIMMLDDNIR